MNSCGEIYISEFYKYCFIDSTVVRDTEENKTFYNLSNAGKASRNYEPKLIIIKFNDLFVCIISTYRVTTTLNVSYKTSKYRTRL
jgi:hypothetical protein